jgi:ubiquinol-cytochrome c reductase cytochrome b subunit
VGGHGKGPIGRLADAVESRTGLGATVSASVDYEIPGGSRWVYVFGTALLATLLLQTVSGILLGFYYVPSVDHAHTTVAYIQKEVALGWLVRGVHNYGASAVILLLMAHLSRTVLWGAYRERREALWLSGIVLLVLVMGFGFTGYLLPWDQKAYFGTQVAGSIAASVPLAGTMQAQLLLGGNDVGQATLSRFFALHVFVLPILTGLVLALHIRFFRRVGAAGAAVGDSSILRRRPYYPAQFARDMAVSIVVVGLLVGLAAWRPAVLGPKADPGAQFVPRPEWYFLWIFELLKVVPAFWGAVVLPGVIVTGLALLPWLDRGPDRRFRKRLVPIGAFAVLAVTVVSLTIVGLTADARDPKIQAQEEAARAYLAEPFVPDEIGGAKGATVEVIGPAPEAFAKNCAGCHGATGEGRIGPSLWGVTAKPSRSVDDLVQLIAKPGTYGLGEGMPSFETLPEAERRGIAAWVASLPKG